MTSEPIINRMLLVINQHALIAKFLCKQIPSIVYVCRYLVDNATREGVEQIISSFPFEHDKQHALAILHTVGVSLQHM